MNPTLEHIWLEFSDRLRQFIRQRVTDPSSAEDILQDVFLKVQLRLEGLRDPTQLQGWIYRIARNAIVDHYRKRRETVELPDTLAAEEENESREREELKAGFRRMIYSLPRLYREALLLTEFDGLTQPELAERLQLSLSGAKSRVQRARGLLREMLLECCRFEFDRRGRVIDALPRRPMACAACACN